MKKDKVIIVMPAYNAGLTLEKTVSDIPEGSYDEIILCDDASGDNTVEISKNLGIITIAHGRNRGYGANQKTCYTEALRRGADIIVMIHPDYQYDSRVVPHLVGLIRKGICDVMLGSRIRTRKETLKGGMPIYKYIFNRCLTIIENIILGQNLGEFHSGLRSFKKEVIEKIPYMENSDDFNFDTEFLFQASFFGFRIGDIPVPVRYFKEASSIGFKRSLIYGIKTVLTIFRYILHICHIRKDRIFIPK